MAMTGLTTVILAMAFLASSSLLGSASAQAQTAAGSGAAVTAVPALRVQPLTARVYFVEGELGPVSRANRGFNSNAGFVVTGDGVVVFDVLGTPALGEALRQAIRTVTALPIRHVVISHYHADHFYGLQAFKDAGAEVWAHQGGKQLHVSTHKRRCPDRDTCPHFAPECERAADHGFISHLVLSSEPLDGDNVWEELCPHEMIGVDARMQLQRFPPPGSGGST